MTWPLWSVVETTGYLQSARKVFSEDEQEEVVFYLSGNPTAGDVIAGGDNVITGKDGLRKARFASGGQGAQRGSRVVYYFGGEDMPLILLLAYKKSVQKDLTSAQKKSLLELLPRLRNAYKPKG